MEDVMEKTNVERLFEWLDQVTETIQLQHDEPYLDSLAITMDILYYEDIPEDYDEVLTHKLEGKLKEIEISDFTMEDIRKAIQLAILKGMKDHTQPHHLMTPETVSLFIGYLADKLMTKQKHIRLFDPVCGTGQLLTAVMNHLKDKEIDTFGSEIDPTLIKIASLSANLQKQSLELFHQDSLRPLLIDPVDLVVADLPVGYYPDDVRAQDFELKADEGHAYVHHLLIEQSLNYTKEDGYLIFLIPEFLFSSDQAEKLYHYLKKTAHIIGVIRLPDSMFKAKNQVKSILILQKQGDMKAPKQPLLVDMPSFSDTAAIADILKKINDWFTQYGEEIVEASEKGE